MSTFLHLFLGGWLWDLCELFEGGRVSFWFISAPGLKGLELVGRGSRRLPAGWLEEIEMEEVVEHDDRFSLYTSWWWGLEAIKELSEYSTGSLDNAGQIEVNHEKSWSSDEAWVSGNWGREIVALFKDLYCAEMSFQHCSEAPLRKNQWKFHLAFYAKVRK